MGWSILIARPLRKFVGEIAKDVTSIFTDDEGIQRAAQFATAALAGLAVNHLLLDPGGALETVADEVVAAVSDEFTDVATDAVPVVATTDVASSASGEVRFGGYTCREGCYHWGDGTIDHPESSCDGDCPR